MSIAVSVPCWRGINNLIRDWRHTCGEFRQLPAVGVDMARVVAVGPLPTRVIAGAAFPSLEWWWCDDKSQGFGGLP